MLARVQPSSEGGRRGHQQPQESHRLDEVAETMESPLIDLEQVRASRTGGPAHPEEGDARWPKGVRRIPAFPHEQSGA